MLADSANYLNGTDIVAENVTTLPATPVAGRLVYLTAQSGNIVPGLYFYNEASTWVLMSGGAALT